MKSILFGLLLIHFCYNKCYGQVYANINLGVGTSNYELLENFKGTYYTIDSNFRQYHVCYGLGTSFLFKRKFKVGFNCNYSTRKFNFKNYEFEFVTYDKYYFNMYDLNLLCSYNLLKFLNVGIIFQKSIFNNIKITTNLVDYNYKLNRTYTNSLFGYCLGLNYFNFDMSFQYLPHSQIKTTSQTLENLFPFSKSRNIQVFLTYNLKLFNINFNSPKNKINCPKL
ncbi:MAG: hypothetical protein ABIO44_04695 [Saprospiraceae bacterium]